MARLYRDGQEVGWLLVHLDAYATQTSGHLWWRRFSRPEDALDLYWIVDGEFGDTITTGERVPDELRDWLAGHFRLRGEVLQLEWTSSEDAEDLNRAHFQIERLGGCS